MKDEPGTTSNKACDLCYRTKLKCVGRDNPPCARCVASRQECTFDGRRKSKITQVEHRVSDIELQLESMQAHMASMMQQLAGMGRAHAGSSVTESPVVPPSRDAGEFVVPHDPASKPGVKRAHAGDGGSSSEEVDEDPLAEVAGGAPLGKMLSGSGDMRRASRTSSLDRPVKYMRLGGPESARLPHLAGSALDDPSPYHPSADYGEEDPVAAGLCTPVLGQDLLDAFYAHCHNSIPVFDPATDTWDGLRARSPFALTAAIMVGAKFMNLPVELQTALQVHTERMAKETLFGGGEALETVQGMIVLTAWGASGWRTGGHQLRLAMEQHLYKCLPHLVRTGMGRSKAPEELEAERPLVVGARVWLAICKAEYEMAFNQGRPLLIGEETSIALGRQLLDHPLSNREDSRLVAACELLRGRQHSHLTFSGLPAMSIEQAAAVIAQDNVFFDAWEADWMDYYDRIQVAPGDFLRDIVTTGKNQSILLTNSTLLHGVRSRSDVNSLCSARRAALYRSVQSASILVRMAVGDTAYHDYFLSANSLTHVAMTFAARLLIRFATLVPDAIDLRRTGRDIEALAQILQRGPGPGAMLAEQIQQVLNRARSKRVLPPRSRAASPKRDRKSRGEGRKMSAMPSREHGGDEEEAGAGRQSASIGQEGAGEPSNGGNGEHNNPGFEFLNEFSFPEDLFSGNVLNDDDATNIFEWLRTSDGSTPGQGPYDWSSS